MPVQHSVNSLQAKITLSFCPSTFCPVIDHFVVSNNNVSSDTTTIALLTTLSPKISFGFATFCTFSSSHQSDARLELKTRNSPLHLRFSCTQKFLFSLPLPFPPKRDISLSLSPKISFVCVPFCQAYILLFSPSWCTSCANTSQFSSPSAVLPPTTISLHYSFLYLRNRNCSLCLCLSLFLNFCTTWKVAIIILQTDATSPPENQQWYCHYRLCNHVPVSVAS